MKKLFLGNRQKIYKPTSKNKKAIILLFFLSAVFYGLSQYIPSKQAASLKSDMRKASELMDEAMNKIRLCREDKGIEINKETDKNNTGIIGVKMSPLTTTLGNLGSKRTTVNPNFAALAVFLLQKAGVKKGDVIAVGASGSFPALVLAVHSASKVMGLNPLFIYSLGASQWGANIPDFNWFHMHECLFHEGIIDVNPVAVTLGGDHDTGENIGEIVRLQLKKQINNSHYNFIHEPDFRNNVEKRMRVYEKKASGEEISAFVNIGGNVSNIGKSSEVLKVKPGFARIKTIPSIDKRGVMFEMAQREVPVIHFLYIKGLADQYGLPWDPSPLPDPGQGELYKIVEEYQNSFLVISLIYLCLCFLGTLYPFTLFKIRKIN